MKVKVLFYAFFLLSSTGFSVRAQSTPAATIKEWERAKAYTKAYLDEMPDSGYAFKPTPEMRSFAQQMLHLTDGNFGLGSAALGVKAPYSPGDLEKSSDKSKANVTRLVLSGYDFIIDALKKMTPAQLGEQIKFLDKFELTRAEALAKTFEHQTHHRGQTTVYLRLEGVKPHEEMLF